MNSQEIQDSKQIINKLRLDCKALPVTEQSEYQRWLKRLDKRLQQNLPINIALSKCEKLLSTQLKTINNKLSKLPKITFPEILPISNHVDEIKKAITENQVIILAGETGSGKTTQLPKICLEMGRGIHAQIGHTQPRRLAARTVALRIAEELQVTLGNGVGYQVRFDDKSNADDYIKLMTDGILLNELHNDPLLKKYDTLIIDEAHERSLNIDFILGILHQVLAKRTDLKVIITSATIDPKRFSKHFNNAPVIEVSGRTYPVETLYMPLSESEDSGSLSMEEGVLQAAELLASDGKGDVLVFLPGERDIRQVSDHLRRHMHGQVEILPLYSRLAQADQMKIFSASKSSKMRIVLATNVAETSLTVPGIHYVIDSGKARMSRYSVRSKIQRLPIEAISQASANQRQGRCGRTANGICIRLFSEEDFLSRPEFTEPEIKRTNLASVILQMAMLELGSVEDFNFLEPPDNRLINDGYKLLQELSAMSASRQITTLGKQLAQLPVDPKIARILLAGADNTALDEILIITSAMSLPDPRERPVEKQQQADEKHQRFKDDDSDFIATLNLWNYFNDAKKSMSWNQLRKVCQKEFLNFNRIREWREIYGQLKRLMQEKNHKINNHAADYDAIHLSLLTGLISQIGEKSTEGDYQSTRNNRFFIFPGSGLFQKRAKKNAQVTADDSNENNKQDNKKSKRSLKWLLAGELVETQKLYARQVAKINPEWIEQIAPGLLKHQCSEPFWSRKSARAMVKENLTLYGLTIIANRAKALALDDEIKAHELFIFHALVENDFVTRASAIVHNRKCLEQVEAMEHRARRRDILVEQDYLENFYQTKIPQQIHTGPAFEKWYSKLSSSEQLAMQFSVEDLIREEAEEIDRASYPETLSINGIELALEYHFEPGAVDDGLHIIIPIATINQFDASDFDWLVPGMLEDKVIALIRNLPKSLRKNFVPVPEYARRLISKIQPGEQSLCSQIAHQLKHMTSVLVSEDDFCSSSPGSENHTVENNIAENLQPLFFVIAMQSNKVIASSRNFIELQEKYADRALEHLSQNHKPTLLNTFPERGFSVTEKSQQQSDVPLFSGLALKDDAVTIKTFDNDAEANAQTKMGLKLLLTKQATKTIKEMKRSLNEFSKTEFQYSALDEPSIDKTASMKSQASYFQQPLSSFYLDLYLLVCDNEISEQACSYHSKSSFEALAQSINQRLLPDIVERSNLLLEIFRQAEKVRKVTSKISSPSLLEVAQLIHLRLNNLMYKGFISDAGWELLHHYPRFLKSLVIRFERAEQNPQLEYERDIIWDKYWTKYQIFNQQSSGKNMVSEQQFNEARWLMEEFHVSLFAQNLGTKKTVSEKRLEKYFG